MREKVRKSTSPYLPHSSAKEHCITCQRALSPKSHKWLPEGLRAAEVRLFCERHRALLKVVQCSFAGDIDLISGQYGSLLRGGI